MINHYTSENNDYVTFCNPISDVGINYKSYEKEVTKTLVDFSHDIVNHQVVLTFINNITKERVTELERYFADNKSEKMQAVIDIIDGFANREGIYPEHVTKGAKEECERYLEKHPPPEVNKYVSADAAAMVVSDFEWNEIEEGQYQLQLKIDDEWHYYPTEGNHESLHSKDDVIHIVDLLFERIKNEDTYSNDIASSLIGYFIEKDLTDYDIIPDGKMSEIEDKLSKLKVELLSNINAGL